MSQPILLASQQAIHFFLFKSHLTLYDFCCEIDASTNHQWLLGMPNDCILGRSHWIMHWDSMLPSIYSKEILTIFYCFIWFEFVSNEIKLSVTSGMYTCSRDRDICDGTVMEGQTNVPPSPLKPAILVVDLHILYMNLIPIDPHSYFCVSIQCSLRQSTLNRQAFCCKPICFYWHSLQLLWDFADSLHCFIWFILFYIFFELIGIDFLLLFLLDCNSYCN